MVYSLIPARLATHAVTANVRRAAVTAPRQARYGTRFSSTMHDNDAETLETEKQRNLRGHQHRTSTPHEHAPGWNEHLASASESYVKADKSDISPEELQAKTVNYVTGRHHADDRTEPTTALYSRDEVSGPLGTAKGTENGQTVFKKTVHEETTEVTRNPTDSEEAVKADRKDF